MNIIIRKIQSEKCSNFPETEKPLLKNFRVIFKLNKGEQVLPLGKMLRSEERCLSFQVEQELYLGPGHPQWDSKNPTASKQKLEREGKWKGDDWRPDGWVERVPYSIPTQAPPKPTDKSSFKYKKAFGKKKKTEL